MGDHAPSSPRLKGLLRRPFSKQAAAYVAYWNFSEIPVLTFKITSIECKKLTNSMLTVIFNIFNF